MGEEISRNQLFYSVMESNTSITTITIFHKYFFYFILFNIVVFVLFDFGKLIDLPDPDFDSDSYYSEGVDIDLMQQQLLDSLATDSYAYLATNHEN